ncbi:hypothetical protein CACET_c30290 [Clostridium aceticum]|uniref:Uncharacterized protein n=1 Tax=Clostridium aceticum TaxID=84022 RepID=A0A0G3WDP8_9CLOT|nr:hypothetical protein [Clostridium aceticum]AKL96473.1 hypothetical protein CACET_c30290 [Clostridium aceticum]
MEFKSEYYTSWSDYVEENNVSSEEEEFIAPNVQSHEDLVFAFSMYLTM